jgi:hypothetical protein
MAEVADAQAAIDSMVTASRAPSVTTSVQSAHTALTGLSIRSYRSGRVTKRTPGMSMRVLRAVGLAAKPEIEPAALVIGSGHLGTFLACQLAEVAPNQLGTPIVERRSGRAVPYVEPDACGTLA